MKNNKLLKGIHKKKNFKSRIMYIPYKNYVFVLTLFIKKTNKGQYLSEYMTGIACKTKDKIKSLKKALNDSEKREIIIAKNNEINNYIKNLLNENEDDKTLVLK